MKFIKDNYVMDSSTGSIQTLKNNEKIMTISVVVPEDFSGSYCMYCPMWTDTDFTCSIVGICPLQEVK